MNSRHYLENQVWTFSGVALKHGWHRTGDFASDALTHTRKTPVGLDEVAAGVVHAGGRT